LAFVGVQEVRWEKEGIERAEEHHRQRLFKEKDAKMNHLT
jgi:hypothetical protein